MKKLTAGIFTALLGLVTVNAANAAIPSTGYVEDRIAEIRSGYEHDDQITLNSAKTYADSKVRALEEGQVATNKTDIASMDTFVAPTVQMTVGEQAQATVTGAINALDARITSATSGLATDGKMKELSDRVDATETDISGLETRMGTAESEIDTLQSEMDAVEVKATANESAITVLKGSETTEGSVAKSVADAKAFVLQEASDMADMAKSDAKKYTDDEISALTTTVNGKASQADLDTAESAIADNAAAILLKASQADLTATNAEVAKKADAATMTTELGKKVDKAQGAEKANHVVITDASGNVTTSATITQAQVENLTTDLAAKMTDVTTVSEAGQEDGVYVLTAKIVGDETTYKWELIQRYDNTPK